MLPSTGQAQTNQHLLCSQARRVQPSREARTPNNAAMVKPRRLSSWRETKSKRIPLKGRGCARGSRTGHKTRDVLCPWLVSCLRQFSWLCLSWVVEMMLYLSAFFSNVTLFFLELLEVVLLFVMVSSCTRASWGPEAPARPLTVASSVDFPAQIQRAMRQPGTPWIFRHTLWCKALGCLSSEDSTHSLGE